MRRSSRRAVARLALATGLCAAALLRPPTAEAATPVSLTLKGQWPGYARGPAHDVAVQGQYAYVAAGDSLHVIDISDPANPVRVGGRDTIGYALGVAVAGNYAYVMNTTGLWVSVTILQVIDVSNAANPAGVGRFDIGMYGSARRVAVAGNLIYVADGSWGLLILEQTRALWLDVSGRNPFTISLFGEPGTEVRLQRSSDLRDWEDWQSATLTDVPVEFPDPEAAGATARFYRAINQ